MIQMAEHWTTWTLSTGSIPDRSTQQNDPARSSILVDQDPHSSPTLRATPCDAMLGRAPIVLRFLQPITSRRSHQLGDCPSPEPLRDGPVAGSAVHIVLCRLPGRDPRDSPPDPGGRVPALHPPDNSDGSTGGDGVDPDGIPAEDDLLPVLPPPFGIPSGSIPIRHPHGSQWG